MPTLNTKLHLDMLQDFKRETSTRGRLGAIYRSITAPLNAMFRRDPFSTKLYGFAWGDPETAEPLRFIRDRYLLPYVDPQHTAVEIGPGGGRWTRYLLPFRRLYVVDYHQELLNELHRNFRSKNMIFIKNNGTDFPGIPDNSVDFVFSFGVFVHLDASIIEQYLQNIRPILRPGGNFLLHYSDWTKIMARENSGFSENTPERMRQMALDAGYEIVEEDLTTMWHSSLMRLQVREAQERGPASAESSQWGR